MDSASGMEMEKVQIIDEGPTLPALMMEDFLQSFEQGIGVYKKWVSLCYRLTRESHWVNHGRTADAPRFSLQGPGAEALANPLGISYGELRFTKEVIKDDRGEFYAWWCEGEASSKTLGNRRGFFIGYCDSRDVFFTARPGWNPSSGSADVKKSAYTNWIVNAVTRLAGIRDPDPKSLEAAGLNPSLIPHIEYRTSSQSQARTLEGGKDPISEPQSKRFYAIAKGQNISDEAIHAYLWDKYQIKSSKDIQKKDYEAVVAWAQRGGQEEPKP